MANVLVKQEWHDVVVEDEMHVDFVKTDKSGIAAFPARTVRAFLLKRILTIAGRILTQGHHASIWSNGTLTAYGSIRLGLGWILS